MRKRNALIVTIMLVADILVYFLIGSPLNCKIMAFLNILGMYVLTFKGYSTAGHFFALIIIFLMIFMNNYNGNFNDADNFEKLHYVALSLVFFFWGIFTIIEPFFTIRYIFGKPEYLKELKNEENNHQ